MQCDQGVHIDILITFAGPCNNQSILIILAIMTCNGHYDNINIYDMCF